MSKEGALHCCPTCGLQGRVSGNPAEEQGSAWGSWLTSAHGLCEVAEQDWSVIETVEPFFAAGTITFDFCNNVTTQFVGDNYLQM